MTRKFLRQLGVRYPIIQAPMGGGGSTPDLVAAVSNAGGLVMIAAPNLTPEQITETIAHVRALTDRPFGINLFTGGHVAAAPVDPRFALSVFAVAHKDLGLSEPDLPPTGRSVSGPVPAGKVPSSVAPSVFLPGRRSPRYRPRARSCTAPPQP